LENRDVRICNSDGKEGEPTFVNTIPQILQILQFLIRRRFSLQTNNFITEFLVDYWIPREFEKHITQQTRSRISTREQNTEDLITEDRPVVCFFGEFVQEDVLRGGI